MPLFNKDNNSVLFVHIPKTAGTSVESAFMDAGYARQFLHMPGKGDGPDKKPCNPQHWHHGLIDRWIYPEHNVSYEFTIVRNPFTRCISELMWKQGRRDTFDEKFFSDLQSFVINNLEQYFKNEQAYQANKDPWLEGNKNFHADNHWRPQWHFVGSNTVVYRYEDLATVWQNLQKKYHLEKLPTEHSKLEIDKPRPTTMGIDPSQKFKDLYLKAYREDHNKFNYPLPFEV